METTIAVTGGASGLGHLIAARMLARRQPVVLVDRDARRLRDASRDLGGRFGLPVATVDADLSTRAGIESVARELSARDDLAGLVNNAGGWLPGTQFPDNQADEWLAALTLNLLAPMLLTHHLWHDLAARSGAVINIGSSGGIGDDAYGSPEYGAAKAGLRRFTSSLAGRDDVRVMCVVPGWIGLSRAEVQWNALTPDQQREVGPLIPPNDVAAVVLRLLDEGAPGEVVEILRKGERRSTLR